MVVAVRGGGVGADLLGREKGGCLLGGGGWYKLGLFCAGVKRSMGAGVGVGVGVWGGVGGVRAM